MKTNKIKEEMCYIGTKPCGCTVAVLLDIEYKGNYQNNLMIEWEQLGYEITRVPLEEARKKLKICLHNDNK